MDALRFLGVDEGADADAIRRAYLRLLRDNKPDQNPEGFKQLRTAYEAATQALGRPDRVPKPHRPAELDRREGLPVEAVDPPIDPLEPYLRRIHEILGTDRDTWDRRVEIAREALVAFPDAAEAFLLLADLLHAAGRENEAKQVLREGTRKGISRCRSQLALWFPDELDTADAAAWRAEARPEDLLQMAWHRLERPPDVEAARELVQLAMERHRAAGAEGSLATGLVLLLIQAHAAGAPALARELTPLADEEMDAPRLDQDEREETAVLWTFLAELNAVPDTFPHKLRTAIASNLLRGRLLDAGDAMHAFAMANADASLDAYFDLGSAPTLKNFFGHLLSGPNSTSYSGSRFAKPGGMGLVVVWLLWVLVRACPGGSPRPPHLPPDLDMVRDWERSQPSYDVIGECIEPGSPSAESPSCQLARDFLDASQRYDCVASLEVLRQLQRLASPSLPTSEEELVGADLPTRLAVRSHESWMASCGQRLVPDPQWGSTQQAPLTADLCTEGDAFASADFCLRARSVLQSLQSADCLSSLQTLNRLNAESSFEGGESNPRYQALAELFALHGERCQP